jgi:hypothetical protein
MQRNKRKEEAGGENLRYLMTIGRRSEIAGGVVRGRYELT